ncbi:hypothetical protein PMAYCL1PPCAC_20185 [Pristionchus mayeri]|uniref:Uncharacterized protein n=1 Tax=Pristionchus mayeri TaxID=1317129 RepID=A0AAN5CT87_9BILA|nr:hypothetical protein PMAYCL1PPCAC_20185 [Pristionchus mayeri]
MSFTRRCGFLAYGYGRLWILYRPFQCRECHRHCGDFANSGRLDGNKTKPVSAIAPVAINDPTPGAAAAELAVKEENIFKAPAITFLTMITISFLTTRNINGFRQSYIL